MNDPNKDRGSFSCVVMKDGPPCLFFGTDPDKVSAFVLANHGKVKSIYPSSSPMFGQTANSGRNLNKGEGNDE